MRGASTTGNLVLVGLLLAGGLIAGCLGDDEAALEGAATEEGPASAEAWVTSLEDTVGCTVAAGLYTAETHAWYCPDRDVCTAVHVPPTADEVTFTVHAEPVDPERTGAGLWAVSVWKGEFSWQHTWETPTDTVSHTVEDPEDGRWGIHLRTQGLHLDTAWNTTIEGSGTAPQDAAEPGLDQRGC